MAADVETNRVMWRQLSPGRAIRSGQQTVTTVGTRVQLSTTSTSILSVTVKALEGNTGTIYVGGSNVSSSNGYELSSSEPVSLDVDNLTDVYIDASVAGEGVSFIYVTP